MQLGLKVQIDSISQRREREKKKKLAEKHQTAKLS